MVEGKAIATDTSNKAEAFEIYRQVLYMEKFHCSYWEYMETPAEFVKDAVTIIGLRDAKSAAKQTVQANKNSPRNR